MHINSAAFVVAAAALASVNAILPVTRNGRYLYTSDGNRFFIKGIAYQPQGNVVADANSAFSEPSTFIDPLADATACARDLPNLQNLTVNTIRVYSVDSTLNHDACMQAFSAAGIYTIIDLSLPSNGSIDRDAPSWSTNLLDQYINTIDVFKQYDNVLAYNIGNEVILANTTFISPYVKAAARDTKAYLQSISSTALVGYAAIDGVSTYREPLSNYLSCDLTGTDSGATALDIFGLNNYEWCGNSTIAAYSGSNADFAGYNVAAYFSEFGCITSPPRLWTEVAAIFGTEMAPIWSGGVAFSYFPATSDQGQFGMTTVNADNSITTNADFATLQGQYTLITSFVNTPSQSDAGATVYPTCAAPNDTFAASLSLPPTPNDAACSCLESALSCQFTPQTSDFQVIVGDIINSACNLIGSMGGSCDDIGGGNGTYGQVASCDPNTKASFVMSEWYESSGKNPVACSFNGNGTVNANVPTSVTNAAAAASSCIANPSAVFTPSAPSATSTVGASGSGSGSSGSSTKNGALQQRNAVFGSLMMVVLTVVGAFLTMA